MLGSDPDHSPTAREVLNCFPNVIGRAMKKIVYIAKVVLNRVERDEKPTNPPHGGDEGGSGAFDLRPHALDIGKAGHGIVKDLHYGRFGEPVVPEDHGPVIYGP